jgi:hypothetical protein
MADIIERIRRLLALSESSNVNEAAAAAAKAAELMAKHQIDAAELQVESGEADEPIEVKDLEVFGGKGKPWRGCLAAALAKANACRAYQQRRRVDGEIVVVARIIGTASGAATVRYMLAYLAREVERLCEAEVKRCRAEWAAMGAGFNARAFAGSFRLGAADEISRRLGEASESAEVTARASASGAALARIDCTKERVDARSAMLGLRKNRAIQITNSSAFRAGQKAGAGVALGAGPALGSGSKGRISRGG